MRCAQAWARKGHDMYDLTTNEIERSLERDRLALAQSLVDLRERLAPAAMISEGKAALLAQARPLASPLVARLDSALRAQPVAATVAGVALAVLVFGRHRAKLAQDAASPVLAGTKFEALTRWEDEGGPPAPEPLVLEDDWLGEARSLRMKASALLSQIDHAARRGLAPAAALARHRADVLAALARDTTLAMGIGLEDLTDAARAKAMEARERMYLSRIVMAEKGRAVTTDHPVALGAVLAAAGAALAWMFPPTETEDRLLGETRDRMLRDLRATAMAEVANASDLALSVSAALGRDIRRIDATLRPERAGSGATIRH